MNKTQRVFPKLTMRETQQKVKSIRREDNGPHGVIGTIMDILTVAKSQRHGVTTKEIGSVLTGMFPDRNGDGMATTIRVQLSRLPKERGFKIRKQREGRAVRYSAA